MIAHQEFGATAPERKKTLSRMIHAEEITLGGYRKGKIYGLLNCRAGKRMKVENRVFFRDEDDAISEGYRPCGTCLPAKYKLWKEGLPFQGDL